MRVGDRVFIYDRKKGKIEQGRIGQSRYAGKYEVQVKNRLRYVPRGSLYRTFKTASEALEADRYKEMLKKYG